MRFGAALCVLHWTVTHIPKASAQRRLQPADTIHLTEFRALVVSPTGGNAAYVRSDYQNAPHSRNSSMWLLDVDKKSSRRLFDFSKESQLSWAPDESRFCYLHGDESDDLPRQQLQCVETGQQEPKTITRLDHGVDSFIWSPDSKNIALLSKVPQPFETLEGVQVFTNALVGYLMDYVHYLNSTEIWTISLDEGSDAKLLASHNTQTRLVSWSPDNLAVRYTTDTLLEPYYGNNTIRLRTVRVSDGKELSSKDLGIPGLSIVGQQVDFIPSPDNTKLAFMRPDPKGPPGFSQMDIAVLDLASMTTNNLNGKYHFDIETVRWASNDVLFALTYVNGNSGIIEVDIHSHKITRWASKGLSMDTNFEAIGTNFEVSTLARHPRLIVTATTPLSPPEIYELHKSGHPVILTQIHAWFRANFYLPAPEAIQFKGPGGQQVHGWLHKPSDFDPAKKYAMVTFAHGGPAWYFDPGFYQHRAALYEAGYIVLSLNPRGSISYGQKLLGALAGKWPGPDYDDYMAGVDYISKRPYIDKSKLAILGGSAGGVMVDWTVTHTNRFAAAISLSDIADFQYHWFINDQPDGYDPKNKSQKPWKDPEDAKLSPLTYMNENVTTPTLFIMGDHDTRTLPATGSYPMYRLFKYYRIPTALVVLKGAGHSGHGGDPRFVSQLDYWGLKWLDLHLYGKKVPEFDVYGIR